jgi:para-nitrobenzyl esterase
MVVLVTTSAGPRARVSAGALCGSHESDVAVFRGVPYAEPPGRFAAPEGVAPWTGERDATSFGPPPPQTGALGVDTASASDAGWLTLNLWSPDLGGRAPVMVWIQGGGYVAGTSGLPEYDGARLARDGGVVVVTLNYRVGVEGFALLPGCPANRGLLDQLAALRWVRDEIHAFGGDPTRVTVFGESAGAGSVASLLAMPTAAGLFRRAVVQSMPGVFLSRELAEDVAAVLAGRLGLTPADLADVPPHELPAVGDGLVADIARYGGRWGPVARRGLPIAPVVDGVVLPSDPWQALRDGAAADVDLLVGHTRDEQRLFSLLTGVLGRVTEEQAEEALRWFAPGPEAVRRYRAMGGTAEELFERVHSDWLFRMPSLHLAEAHTGRTHVYELTWPAPGLGGALGACHGLDVPLVFGTVDRGQPAMLLADGRDDAEAVSAVMRAAWTAFAADGDPGWPAYDRERLTCVFDLEPAVLADPEESSRRLWEEHPFAALPLRDVAPGGGRPPG